MKLTKTQKNIIKLNKLFDEFIDKTYLTRERYEKAHKGSGHRERIKVTQAAELSHYTWYELVYSEAIIYVGSKDQRSHKAFISKEFLDYINREN